MTDAPPEFAPGSTVTSPPTFGEWVIVTGDHVDGFPAGTKGLIISTKIEDGEVLVVRPAENGQFDPVQRDIRVEHLTTDLSWLPLAAEARVSCLVEGIVGIVGSRISRTDALALLAELDAHTAEASA